MSAFCSCVGAPTPNTLCQPLADFVLTHGLHCSSQLLSGPEVEKCKQKWPGKAIEDKYSLLVPMHGHVNFSRYIEHYMRSDKVDRVVLVWSNKDEAPPDWSMYPKVCTVVQETDNLVTRTEGKLPIEYGSLLLQLGCLNAVRRYDLFGGLCSTTDVQLRLWCTCLLACSF